MITLLAFALVIGVLVLVHESGHYLTAKSLGVPVDVFSFGFGPPLWKKKIGGTEYQLAAFPLGGFVKIAGMDEDHDRPDGYYSKPKWQRLMIIAAGPISNMILAVFIFIGSNYLHGIPTEQPSNIVLEVLRDSPAEKVGLKPNDVIVAINGKKIERGEEMVALIHKSPGVPLLLTVRRAGEELHLRVTPKASKLEGKSVGLIGFYPQPISKKVGFLESVELGFKRTYFISSAFVLFVPQAIAKAVTGKKGGPQLVGPVGIAKMAGQQAALGVEQLLLFIAMISINLGLINLFPFPALDGGHLLFLGIETIRGKRMDPSKENMIHLVGFALLLLLMAVVIVQDVVRGVPTAPRMP